MTKTNRVNEIISQITAFSQETYRHEDLLPELLKLQKELISLVFNDVHAEDASLRIWDVENHFRKLNEKNGHIADEEIDKVIRGCRIICNMIKSEFSGRAGEQKAFWSLEKVRCKNQILKNIEFKNEKHRTELDAIVFTAKAVFVIEVKNPRKDIYIDEKGNYCRVDQTMTFDKNIGEKMSDKVFFLRQALKRVGVENPNIETLVVFTNNSIQVKNQYSYIKSCFLSELPFLIENYKGDNIFSDEDIAKMVEGVEESFCKESYPLPFDMQQFKKDFAVALAILEEFSTIQRECLDDVEENDSMSFGREEIKPSVKKNDSERRKNVLPIGIGTFSVVTIAWYAYKIIKKQY